MMKSKVFKLSFVFVLGSFFLFSQNKISGHVYEQNSNIALEGVSIYNSNNDTIYLTNKNGYFEIETTKDEAILTFILEGYVIKEKLINFSSSQILKIYLLNNLNVLNEVVVRASKKRFFKYKDSKIMKKRQYMRGKKMRQY